MFSRETYNGYYMISLSDEPSTVLLFGKKGAEKDEEGFVVTDVLESDKVCQCDYMARRIRPWEPWLYVPSACQKCPWVYRTPGNEYSCLLFDKDKKVRPSALVNGGR